MCDQIQSAALPASRPWASTFQRLRQSLARRGPRLDLDSLPQHLKRDLGFSTGRLSAPHDPMRD
jgi:hypothetical protein